MSKKSKIRCGGLIYLVSFVLVLGLAGRIVNADIKTGLVSHWRLNERSGITAKDSATNNDGTLHGDATWVTGWIGGAIKLDGDGDYVDCGNSNMFDITQQITLAVWVQPDPQFAYPPVWAGIIIKGGPNLDTFGFYYDVRGGGQLGFKTTGTSPPWIPIGAPALFDDDWHHVAAVYDGTRKIVYLDGQEIGGGDSAGTIVTSTGRLLLGAGRD